MAKVTRLFEPIKVGEIELKNRIVFLPQTPRLDDNERVTNAYINYGNVPL